MNETSATMSHNPPGLEGLSTVELNERNRLLLEMAETESSGDAAWRRRKRREAANLLALSQIAPPGRLEVAWIDLRQQLRALLFMGVPVPCRPDQSNELQVVKSAHLGFNYPPEAVRQPLPGWAFVQILMPQDVWLPNCRQPEQPLCLSPTLPAGVRVVPLILMAYGSLSMQAAQVDEFDPAGVFNVEAARWWQQNMHRIPLSRAAFLAPDKP